MNPQVYSVTPILPVEDVEATLAYYESALGAINVWKWGDPPDYAGCQLGSVWLHFSLAADLCQRTRGISMFLNVLHIDELYERHQHLNATIISPLEPKPWNTREYTVEDCNGVLLRFSQPGFTTSRKESLTGLSIARRRLKADELRELMISVRWNFEDTEEAWSRSINDPLHTSIAELDGKCIGTGSILGHETGNYLIFNVIVHSDFQSQGVGKKIMADLDDWLSQNGVPHALVKLFTGLDRQDFYRQFGFSGAESGLVGMTKPLNLNRE